MSTRTVCNNATKYANSSKFVSNLNIVLDELVRKTSETGFNTSSYGQSPNRVYGVLQCRGDASQQDCYNCSRDAKLNIQQEYTDAHYYLWSTAAYNATSNPQAIMNAARSLLQYLSVKATNPANKGFAAGSNFDSDSRNIYGMDECCRDISIDDCKRCLSTARKDIFIHSAGNQGEKSSHKLPIIMGLIGNVIMTLILLCVFTMRRKPKSVMRWKPFLQWQDEACEDIPVSLLNAEQIIFNLESLVVATENFYEGNKLGEDGFGPVYKRRISDGREVAVKKLSVRSGSGQGKKEFINELELVAKIQHRNLVKLIGCCAEGPERLIVYEYLPNKSLDTFLFHSERRRQLKWQERYNIILGIARGLLYLHEDSQLRIIHRDIKANNILLDDKLNPKIADFGLARLFGEDEIHVHTRVVGTCGYMAPEYAMRGQLSVKADVYSFGVLLLEIVSGRKNTDYTLPLEAQNILEWTWRLYKRGQILDVIDEELVRSCPEEQALRCIHAGLLYTQADPTLRPPMSNFSTRVPK
eukprot:Gb_13105 [translate_table: standard]